MKLLTPDLGLLFWTLLSFLVVLFILAKYAWPSIVKALKEREKSITDSLAMAERVKAEMTQMQSENEALLTKAREERTLMLKDAREIKDKIIGEAKEQAKTEANKIFLDAQASIQTSKMAALTDVKNQLGMLVIEVAEKVLRRELGNKAEQEKYIKQVSNEVKLN